MPDDLNQPSGPTVQVPPITPSVPGTEPPQPPPGLPPEGPPKPAETPVEPTPPSPPPSEEPSLVISTPPKKSRVKVIMASIILLVLLVSVPGAVYLVQRRVFAPKAAGCDRDCSATRDNKECWTWAGSGCAWEGDPYSGSCICKRGEEPTPTPPPSSQKCTKKDGSPGETCANLDKCDVDGGCNPACCAYNKNCGANGKICDIPNGYCQSGYSSRDCNTPGYTKKCVGTQCVNQVCAVGEPCTPECSNNDQCKKVTPTPTQPPGGNYCSPHGFTKVGCAGLPGDIATCEGSGGQCCKSSQGNPFCCWANGMCSGGFRSGCSETGPGKVKVENQTGTNFNVTVQKNICGPGVCPCTKEASRTTVVVNAGTSREFSLGADKCGQIEVFWTEAGGGGCGSCKTTGCEEEVTPTPPPPDTARCDFCKVYDTDWNEIPDLSTLTVGQTVYFATRGATTHAQGITKARFRITIDGVVGSWQQTTEKHDNKFYIEYTIPSAGSYAVESMVYNPVLGWW